MKGFRPRALGFSSVLSIVNSMVGLTVGNSLFHPRIFAKPIPQGPKKPVYRHRSGWLYDVAGPDSREAARRRRQGAHQRQIDSHKPGTVQPRHIFGAEGAAS